MNTARLACLVLLGTFFSLRGFQGVTIRTDVNLVQLQATVTDSNGQVVRNLDRKAFQAFLDDVPQAITFFEKEDAPVSAGIVIDNSASMAPKKTDVLAGALAFAGASNALDQMFVVHFDCCPRLGLPPGISFTGKVAELEKAIEFEPAGTTALYDGLMLAESHLHGAVFPRKVLLLISDGGDNSSRTTLNQLSDTLARASVVVYAIGIYDDNDRDRKPEILQKIAEQSGGKAYFPEHLSDVTDTCIMIAHDIRSRYTLGFPGPEDGKYHRIRVTATDPGRGAMQVHTRQGYLAQKPAGK